MRARAGERRGPGRYRDPSQGRRALNVLARDPPLARAPRRSVDRGLRRVGGGLSPVWLEALDFPRPEPRARRRRRAARRAEPLRAPGRAPRERPSTPGRVRAEHPLWDGARRCAVALQGAGRRAGRPAPRRPDAAERVLGAARDPRLRAQRVGDHLRPRHGQRVRGRHRVPRRDAHDPTDLCQGLM